MYEWKNCKVSKFAIKSYLRNINWNQNSVYTNTKANKKSSPKHFIQGVGLCTDIKWKQSKIKIFLHFMSNRPQVIETIILHQQGQIEELKNSLKSNLEAEPCLTICPRKQELLRALKLVSEKHLNLKCTRRSTSAKLHSITVKPTSFPRCSQLILGTVLNTSLRVN